MPAAHVEAEAKDRLGLETAADGREIEAAIALRYPDEIGDAHDLLRRAICRPPVILRLHRERRAPAVSPNPAGSTALWRTWPTWSASSPSRSTPWTGQPPPCRRASTAPPDSSTTWIKPGPALQRQSRQAPGYGQRAPDPPHGLRHHRQPPWCSTIRLPGCTPRSSPSPLPAATVWTTRRARSLAAWTAILNINYWPIFAIAKDILGHFDSADAARILHGGCGTPPRPSTQPASKTPTT